MIATLAGEPWCMPRDEIRKLSDWYIREILFHKRDEKGQIVHDTSNDEPGQTFKETFWQSFKMRNFPEYLIQEKWKEHEARQPVQPPREDSFG